jgi:hypothetical protein
MLQKGKGRGRDAEKEAETQKWGFITCRSCAKDVARGIFVGTGRINFTHSKILTTRSRTRRENT